MRILVVDDERAVRDAVDRALRLDGHEVALAADGRAALDAIANAPPDAVVLDLLMPHVDGLEVCRRLRAAGNRTPVLVLTARDAVSDRVRGLDAGADDYLVKPFALAELLARVRALLRRSGSDEDGVLRCDDLTLDASAYEVRRGDCQVEHTRTEFALLELFLRHPRQVLTRSVIFDRATLEPALVDCVPARLDRAVANLLDNAAKYSPAGGTVEVSLRDGELVVRDHGPGIAAEDLLFVFDRFYRAPSARGRPGSGLGLAIVRQAAEAHGGSVRAEAAPGGGAVLRLALLSTS